MQGIIGTILGLLLLFIIPGEPAAPTANTSIVEMQNSSYNGGGRVDPQAYKGKTIVIDPGHGGHNPGAIGITGAYEKDINLNVAMGVRERLMASGANVVMTRSGDYDLDLPERVRMANVRDADLFISIHSNTHSSAKVEGIQTFYYGKGSSASLARNIQDQLLETTSAPDKGVLSSSFYVVKNTAMPAALVEVGFISNYEEETKLSNLSYRHHVAEGIYNGIGAYLTEHAG
jgi:N-acetylmuramoyl-L-alanine amidase